MLRRTGRILLIVWQVWCLNVFLPSHTRGAMTVGKATHTCCEPAETRDRDDSKNNKPTPEEQSRCSVCYFAAGLSTPPVFDLDLQPSGLVDRIDPPAPALVASNDYPLPYYACGPPAIA
jgi:hypothetical protein